MFCTKPSAIACLSLAQVSLPSPLDAYVKVHIRLTHCSRWHQLTAVLSASSDSLLDLQESVKQASKDMAMALYNLEHLQLLRDPHTNTKCLVAWGQDTCVIAFRGTANRQNAVHDVKVSHYCKPAMPFSPAIMNTFCIDNCGGAVPFPHTYVTPA